MARTAAALHAAAVESVNRGWHARAVALLDAASASGPEARLRARIEGTRALILARTGELAAAEDLCLRALATPGLDAATTAVLRGQLGTIAERAGRLPDAERWLSAAIDTMSDAVPRAHLLVNRSSVRIQRGELDRAGADCAAAERIYRENDLTIDAAEAQHNGGYVALLRGDLVTAMQLMASARIVLERVSAVTLAVCDLDRAAVLRDAGAVRDAERLLRKVDATFARARMPRDRADTELQLGRLLLVHDPRRAGIAAAAAERRFRRLANPVSAARAAGVRLRARLAQGVIPAGPTGESVAVELDRQGLRDDAAAIRFARVVAETTRDPDVAGGRRGPGGAGGRRTPRSRMPRLPADATLETRLLAAEARASRLAHDRRDAASRRAAAAGLDILGDWLHTFGSLDLQSSVAAQGAPLVRAGLASALRSGRPDVVFSWSERARELYLQVTPLRPPPDAELAGDLAELRLLRAEGPGWEASDRARDLRDRARERQWTTTGAAAPVTRVEVEGLRAVLSGDTALLAFVFTGAAMAAVVVADDVTSIVAVEDWPRVQAQLAALRADLDMAAEVRSGPLAAVVRRSLEGRLADVSAALLDDALRLVDQRRLVITTPGVLAGLPWAMLPGLRGRVFTLATSATRWAATPRPVAASHRSGFVVGPRVARGAEEVATGARAWPSAEVIDGDAATTAAATALAERVDVLHVAAHGRHAVDNPLFSGLELADGALFGYDVDLVPRVPSVVVLSSCEVGRSTVRGGEEAIGMTRVWLHAGTRCVIATPVVVADDDACELLGAMHADLAAGAEPAVALAAASVRTGIVSSFQAHGSGF